MLDLALWIGGVAIALFALDRLFLWMESRGSTGAGRSWEKCIARARRLWLHPPDIWHPEDASANTSSNTRMTASGKFWTA